jgi:hypothetical protein
MSTDAQKNRTLCHDLNNEWLAGKRIEGLRFLHNSFVKTTLLDGTTKTGWIVSAHQGTEEPIYTVEAEDGSGDIESVESAITIIL